MKAMNLSKDELRALISEVVEEKLREFFDPDHGLELSEDFKAALSASMESEERVSFDEVKKRLGLS